MILKARSIQGLGEYVPIVDEYGKFHARVFDHIFSASSLDALDAEISGVVEQAVAAIAVETSDHWRESSYSENPPAVEFFPVMILYFDRENPYPSRPWYWGTWAWHRGVEVIDDWPDFRISTEWVPGPPCRAMTDTDPWEYQLIPFEDTTWHQLSHARKKMDSAFQECVDITASELLSRTSSRVVVFRK